MQILVHLFHIVEHYPRDEQTVLQEHKLLIRDASNFKGMDRSFCRLSVQAPEHNQTLVNAIKTWISQ